MCTAGPKGFFLTIEGIEGVGKSTAIQYIKDYLLHANQDIILTREPGGTSLAEELRKLLLATHFETLTPDTELLLMFACRAQHIAQVISPGLHAGKWVISDRFIDASFAYQGGGRKMNMDRLHFLERWIVKDLKPDATILLDAPPEVGLARAKNRGAHDRIEQEKIDFFERVRAAYLLRAKQEPHRFHMIDATQPLDTVQEEIKKLLNLWLASHPGERST